MAFAESLIKAKPVLFGEVTPAVKEGEPVVKDIAVKLAEAPFKAFAEANGSPEIIRAPLAVEARKMFSESGGKMTYKQCLLAVASQRLGTYHRGNYAEIEQEVA